MKMKQLASLPNIIVMWPLYLFVHCPQGFDTVLQFVFSGADIVEPVD